MRVVEKEGKTEEEAIRLALEELGAKKEDVRIEYLEKSKSSFLGLGNNKMARVRVFYLEKLAEKAIDVLNIIFKLMSLEAETEIVEELENKVYLRIKSSDSGIIIGKFGKTLESIQLITNAIVNKKRETNTHIILDIENYRDKRVETLKFLARRALEEVKRTRRPYIFRSMNPFERRIIHIELKDDKDVKTYSIGEGAMRKVKVVFGAESEGLQTQDEGQSEEKL